MTHPIATYAMFLRGLNRAIHFNANEVRECDDFADPERDEVLALKPNETVRLSDGTVVERLT